VIRKSIITINCENNDEENITEKNNEESTAKK
jgi:hypothetical protein